MQVLSTETDMESWQNLFNIQDFKSRLLVEKADPFCGEKKVTTNC